MARVLVYNGRSTYPAQLLGAIAEPHGLSHSYTEDVDELERMLCPEIDFVLLLIDREPALGLSVLLQRVRDRGDGETQFAALHAHYNAAGIRSMLRLGVRAIYAEPVGHGEIVAAARHAHHRKSSAPPRADGLREVPALVCEVEALSALEEISAPNQVTINTSLGLSVGDTVDLLGDLPAALDLERIEITVRRRESTEARYGHKLVALLGLSASEAGRLQPLIGDKERFRKLTCDAGWVRCSLAYDAKVMRLGGASLVLESKYSVGPGHPVEVVSSDLERPELPIVQAISSGSTKKNGLFELRLEQVPHTRDRRLSLSSRSARSSLPPRPSRSVPPPRRSITPRRRKKSRQVWPTLAVLASLALIVALGFWLQPFFVEYRRSFEEKTRVDTENMSSAEDISDAVRNIFR